MLTLILLAAAVLPARAEAPAGSCVECHRGLASASTLEHTFADWEASRHAKAGVGCGNCHRGDPASQDKTAAHEGVLRSGDARSPVYFTNIPATCGACHQSELKAFQRSAHFKELERSGRGPNCVTCHGSMANHVLGPRELETVCVVCHRKPTLASATLMSLDTSKAALGRLAAALVKAKEKGVEAAAQAAALESARGEERQALEDWHTFKMDGVLRRSQAVTRRCNTAVSELKVKGAP